MEKLLKLSTVIHAVNEQIETFTVNVPSWTMILEGIGLHLSSFCILQELWCICFNFQQVTFRAWFYVTSTEKRRDLRCSRNSLPFHGNGMLRNSRSHLVVLHQRPLNWIRCWWAWHNENCSLDNMATELMQTSEVSTTAFRDDALEVAVILHWRNRAFVTFLKV